MTFLGPTDRHTEPNTNKLKLLESLLQEMSVKNGLGTGQEANIRGPWGPQGSHVAEGQSYSSITAINTSIRDDKNVLEVRLERQQGASFRLSQLEIETLLVKLGIDGSHFLGVSACPQGKPVVLITLHPSVDIKKFLYRNESYVVKEGVRTTSIRPASKKDVIVTVSGLHPNTRDQAVVRYFEAHGNVSKTEKITHHVFPGEVGSSLCAGKLNGNRSYVMEIKVPMGSFHIIDGEKVTIRYPGQEWSCARCHNFKRSCPGFAIARDCTAERVLLSSHMEAHWKQIGFKPETKAEAEVDDDLDLDIQVGQVRRNLPTIPESNLTHKYKSIIVKGFLPSMGLENILKELKENGLPQSYNNDDLLQNDKSGAITLSNLQPEECLTIMENMHAKKFIGRKVFVTSVVSNSPTKSNLATADDSSSTTATPGKPVENTSSSSDSVPLSSSPILDPRANSSLKVSTDPNLGSSVKNGLEEFEFDPPFEANFELVNKRKASMSPEVKEPSRKDKKAAKKEQRNKNKGEIKSRRLLEISPQNI